VVRVQLVNGRTLWLQDLVDDDEDWLERYEQQRAGRAVVAGVRVKAVRPN
jgi:hypothetical protein